jgi:hypothetical protein
MSSHLHLAMIAGARRAESWLKRTHVPFATWMKERYEGLGVLFAGRPKMIAVHGEEKVRDLLAYIHNNPVRGGVVRHADETDWTSHRAYLGRARAPAWLAVGEGLRRAGIDDPAAFHAFVVASEDVEHFAETDRILAAVARKVHRRGGVEVATPEIGERTSIPLVARPFAGIRPDPRAVVEVVTGMMGLHREAAFGRHRPEAILVRRYIITVGLMMGLTLAELSAATGISKSSGSRLADLSTDGLDAEVISAARRRLAGEWAELNSVPR